MEVKAYRIYSALFIQISSFAEKKRQDGASCCHATISDTNKFPLNG